MYALELKEADAEAHFLYGAALGQAGELKGGTSSLLSLKGMGCVIKSADFFPFCVSEICARNFLRKNLASAGIHELGIMRTFRSTTLLLR